MIKNPGAKGARNEKKAEQELLKQGYLVEKRVRGKWVTNDFFGLFDIIAMHPEKKEWLLVQVKTNTMPPPAYRESITALQVPPFTRKELWIYYDRVEAPRIIPL